MYFKYFIDCLFKFALIILVQYITVYSIQSSFWLVVQSRDKQLLAVWVEAAAAENLFVSALDVAGDVLHPQAGNWLVITMFSSVAKV